ncbi:putative lipoprotein [Methylophaga frappieri]|uniref:Putative lipoprotein n=1 Tax=Methylophaga frappieri (strain ATCC BAA-2434 / DSM 25690 / JAM7) TaxID=754477 RepID=I1YHJ5_METFJ|nr:hypothetical protein [Methylophaga frappieri]AFJ02388.1 putative lipoprotein [Methylophaga frappieri]
MKGFSLVLMIFCLTACGSAKPPKSINQFGKSTIDEIIELHQQRVIQDLKTLTLKLYRRNPNERHDRGKRTLEESVARLFNYPALAGFSKWKNTKPTDILRDALSPEYEGDRVLAFTVGMRRMLMASYDYKTDFYYLTEIDAQKLYNSARNIEIAAWLLATRRDHQGNRVLLSDSTAALEQNLSFQRLIGGMITTQENLSQIIATRQGRMVKTVVIQAASMAFLPI